MSTQIEEKNEFFKKTIDENNEVKDISKVGKYKKTKTADIIVFPDIKNKKKIYSGRSSNTQSIDDLNDLNNKNRGI